MFHTTGAAEAILSQGFRDATGSYLGVMLTGVWMSDKPVDSNEGAKGDQVLRVNFPSDVDIDAYELIEDGKTYREWCVPAALVNDHAKVVLMTDEMLEANAALDSVFGAMRASPAGWGDKTILRVCVTDVDEHGEFELAVIRDGDEDAYYEPSRCSINDPEGERQEFYAQVDSLYAEWRRDREDRWGRWWNGKGSSRRRGWKIREMLKPGTQ